MHYTVDSSILRVNIQSPPLEPRFMEVIVECVPNISEGRDSEKIKRITQAVYGIEGCAVLGVEPDSDYNRTVITIAGEPQAVKEAAFLLIQKATFRPICMEQQLSTRIKIYSLRFVKGNMKDLKHD